MSRTFDRAAALAARPLGWPSDRLLTLGLTLWGFAAAVSIGLAVGNPTPESLWRGLFFCVATVMVVAYRQPFWAFLGIASSLVMLIVVPVTLEQGLNLLDLLIPPVLVAGLMGTVRQQALAAEATETGERHKTIRHAQRRLTRAALLYFSIAALSVIPMFFDGRAAVGESSLLRLVRAGQGLILFPLGLWYLRSERRIRQTMTAMGAATLGLLAVNIPVRLLTDVKRAGMTWFITYPQAPIADPNEGAAAMLFVVALLVALRSSRPHWSQVVMACAAVVMLVMTYSRSGLLAFIVFSAIVVPKTRLKQVLLIGLVLVAALPLVPQEYWQRMMRTLLMQKGTWDNYSSMIRFISWATATNVFIHHPIFGVGYIGLESVSTAYNDMRIRIGAESYMLEIAADLGIAGLIAFGNVIVKILQLGRAIRKVAPPGTMGSRMAGLNAPMLLAILVANLTGSNLLGMVGIGQIALWCVMMVRAGHEALKVPTLAAAGVARPAAE